MKTIAGYVVLTCSLHQEKDQWVSICPELGISSLVLVLMKLKIHFMN